MLFLLAILLTYQDLDTTTEKISSDHVEIHQQETGFLVKMRGPDFSRTTHYDQNGFLQELEEIGEKDKLHILRQNDQIAISCTRNGKTKKLTHKGVKEPWIQELYFGLKAFTLSDQPKLKYVSINPDDLTLVTMVLTRKEHEVVEGKKAVKLHMTVDGWRGKFWEAWSWTDADTGFLLQKKGNKGPLTPTVITKLITSS